MYIFFNIYTQRRNNNACIFTLKQVTNYILTLFRCLFLRLFVKTKRIVLFIFNPPKNRLYVNYFRHKDTLKTDTQPIYR